MSPHATRHAVVACGFFSLSDSSLAVADENYGADTAEGYSYSSSAFPMYGWGALAGFVGLRTEGFYSPLHNASMELF